MPSRCVARHAFVMKQDHGMRRSSVLVSCRRLQSGIAFAAVHTSTGVDATPTSTNGSEVAKVRHHPDAPFERFPPQLTARLTFRISEQQISYLDLLTIWFAVDTKQLEYQEQALLHLPLKVVAAVAAPPGLTKRRRLPIRAVPLAEGSPRMT